MRPQVRIIQDQSVESTREITGSEAEEILRRYGHAPQQQFSTRQEEPQQPVDDGLTFEQMVAQQEAKKRGEEMRRQQRLNGPKPITFQGTQYDTEVKYGSDDELGFGFKIEITTDMKLPKNY